MATVKVDGSKELSEKLAGLTEETGEICKRVLYSGGGVYADKIRENMERLPVDNNPHGKPSDMVNVISKQQKEDLINSFGISRIKFLADMTYQEAIGFKGYNTIKTKTYPMGQPNQMVARAIESGTSFRVRTPFVDPARKKAKKEAVKAEQDTLNEEITKAMEGKTE